MASLEVELNTGAIGDYLKHDTQPVLESVANEVARKLKTDAKVDIYVGKTRANASVTVKLDDTKNNELLKALK